MGKHLQIRVMAYTYDADELPKIWPNLCNLAFGDDSVAGAGTHGVLELAQALDDGCNFAPWNEQFKAVLRPAMPTLVALLADMEKALANWDARSANVLSEKIEDALEALEKEVPKA